MKIGDKISIKIDKFVFGGEGLGFVDNKAIFVPESVPGDELEIEIISDKKDYARGLISNILKPSKDRIEPSCEYFSECGGCDFMTVDYEKQLEYKKIMVSEVLERVGKIDGSMIKKIHGMKEPYEYRNKIIQPFEYKRGRVITGFYKKRTHEVIDIENCAIQTKLSNKILKKIKEILEKNRISIYDEKTNSGLVRNVMIRTNSREDIMVVFVINGDDIPKRERIVNDLTSEFSSIKSMYISINKKATNVVMGSKNTRIFGKREIGEDINGIKFYISPLSFFQVNNEQMRVLYSLAEEFLGNVDEKNIVDAYSGTGTIGMLLSKKAKKVFCIETIKDAVDDSKKTAEKNEIKNVEFICGETEVELMKLIENGEKLDAIVFDPPRKGLEKIIIDKTAEANIKNIVYISCNPSTFARDAGLFVSKGYKIEKIEAVDMFPQTHHIELVAKIVKIQEAVI